MVCRAGLAERQLASALLQLLFNKLEESDEKLVKNAEFFILLCRCAEIAISSLSELSNQYILLEMRKYP